MRRLFTKEVNAAAVAAFAAGAELVLINDSHGSGYNIIFEELDPRCEIIHGRNCSGPHWLPELDSSFAALLLVGMHAMGGTPNALLPHSRWEVNDGEIYLSEASMAAAIAGEHGVPTVLVSGDDKITAELKEKIPGIVGATVKKALGAYLARSLMPEQAAALIAQGVRKGLRHRKKIRPYVIPGPLRLNLLDSPTHAPPLKRLAPRPVEADSIDAAFMKFERQMPWTSFNTELPDGFIYP
jgi:D-amino peptidase